MKNLTHNQSILVFFHFLRNTLDFPFFPLTFGMEIAFTFPEQTLGQMKPEPRTAFWENSFLHTLTSKSLSCTFPHSLHFALLGYLKWLVFLVNEVESEGSLYHLLPQLPWLGWVEEEGGSFTNIPPPWGAAAACLNFRNLNLCHRAQIIHSLFQTSSSSI